jgi:LSD1 subclass zinc finger protein
MDVPSHEGAGAVTDPTSNEWYLKCHECTTVLAVKKGTKKFRCAVCNTVAEIPAQAAASQWGPLLQEGATAVEFINSPWSFLDATLDVISETVDEATDVLSSAPTMAARGVEMGVKELPLPGKKG